MPATRPLLPTVTVALLLGLTLFGAFFASGGPEALPAELTPSAATGDTLPIDSSTSLLVVSPHPDDETLCCAGVIQRAQRAGARVSVVWITSGDGSRLDALLLQGSLLASPARLRALGEQRMREARAATASLGVPANRQLFLGYPDGGLATLLASDSAIPYRSKTSGARHVPYSGALFPGHPYTRQSLQQDFARVLDRVHPTLILAPSIEDRHPDHSAVGLLTLRVLTIRGMLPSLRFWIVHGPAGWPGPRGLFTPLPLSPPRHGPQLQPLALALDADEETRKLEAIRMYHSQMQVMGPFLLAFVRTNEIFFREPAAAPVLPPSAPPAPTLRSP